MHINADRWLNHSEFELEASMTAKLEATNKEPVETLNVDALIVVRVAGNKGYVVRGKYREYGTVPTNPGN